MSTAETLAEATLVVLTVLPKELSEAVKPAFTVLALVKVSIFEVLHPFAVLNKVYKGSLIPIPLAISEDSEAIGCALFPLSDIGVSLLIPPHA